VYDIVVVVDEDFVWSVRLTLYIYYGLFVCSCIYLLISICGFVSGLCGCVSVLSMCGGQDTASGAESLFLVW
jgi:hypothetical protein